VAECELIRPDWIRVRSNKDRYLAGLGPGLTREVRQSSPGIDPVRKTASIVEGPVRSAADLQLRRASISSARLRRSFLLRAGRSRYFAVQLRSWIRRSFRGTREKAAWTVFLSPGCQRATVSWGCPRRRQECVSAMWVIPCFFLIRVCNLVH